MFQIDEAHRKAPWAACSLAKKDVPRHAQCQKIDETVLLDIAKTLHKHVCQVQGSATRCDTVMTDVKIHSLRQQQLPLQASFGLINET